MQVVPGGFFFVPALAADRCPMALAFVIRAIDQEAANASDAHFPEGDLSGGGGHGAVYLSGLIQERPEESVLLTKYLDTDAM